MFLSRIESWYTIVRERSFFSDMLHYIPHQDLQTVFFFYTCYYINKNLKKTRVKTWVKISKVMPQPKSISPGKGREALRKNSKSFI